MPGTKRLTVLSALQVFSHLILNQSCVSDRNNLPILQDGTKLREMTPLPHDYTGK